MSETFADGVVVSARSIAADQLALPQAPEIVEQAAQAISARLATTPEVAFAMLCGLSRSQQRNLEEYAAEVLAQDGRLG